MTFWKWSRTASANATADSTCPFPEGMAPSAVNDGVRGAMAAVAKYRDDIAGAIVTGGTSTAYTVSSYQVFDTFAHMDGALIAFTPHATNGATVTLNVDGLGAKPLRSAQGVELLAGTLIQTAPYAALYNNTDGVWYLHGFFGNAYNVPLLGGMDYWGTVAPNSAFIFPLGQALSRTTYAGAFAVWGTTFGSGDGSSTFNVPDKGERVSVMKVAIGTRLTTAGSGVDGGTMGATGGAQNKTLLTANLPPYTPSGTVTVSQGGAWSNVLHNTIGSNNLRTGTDGANVPAYPPDTVQPISASATFAGTPAPGQTSTPFATVQPTIVCNYMVRVL